MLTLRNSARAFACLIGVHKLAIGSPASVGKMTSFGSFRFVYSAEIKEILINIVSSTPGCLLLLESRTSSPALI